MLTFLTILVGAGSAKEAQLKSMSKNERDTMVTELVVSKRLNIVFIYPIAYILNQVLFIR